MTLLVPTDPPTDLPVAGRPDPTALRLGVAGRVTLPGDPGYGELSTPWNVAATSAPVAVVEVTGPADVAAALRHAAAADLEVAVRLTGHGAVAHTRPTVLVLTHLLDEVTIDPGTRTARIGAGVRSG